MPYSVVRRGDYSTVPVAEFYTSSRSIPTEQVMPRAVIRSVAALLTTASLLASMCTAAGCGVYYTPGDSACSDPQCSRTVQNADGEAFCVRGQAEMGVCEGDSDCYIHLTCNSTGTGLPGFCVKGSDDKEAWKGFTAVGISVLAFGSFLVPARRVDPGNALFFQFCMSCGIMVVGFAVQMWRNDATFYPYAMIGGMLWCLGNTLAVPALKMISLGVALSIWGASNMLLGWASGRFGIWGLDKEIVKVQWLSYTGVGFAIVGIVTLAMVKKTAARARHGDEGYNELRDGAARTSSDGGFAVTSPFAQVEIVHKEELSDFLSKGQMRALGVCLAIAAGCFFGLNFDPPTYLANNFADKSLHGNVKYSPDGIDYAFSHFFGIFFTSMVLLVTFSGVDMVVNLPQLFHGNPFPELVVPGFISGVIWSIGQTAWFVANTNLGLVVSFPIICLGPSLLASFWSVVLFGEIRGGKNFALLGVSFFMLALSAGSTVIAKEGW